MIQAYLENINYSSEIYSLDFVRAFRSDILTAIGFAFRSELNFLIKNGDMKKKVVIVEDDQLLALILKKMAASIDLEVLTVSQFGREAVETILQENPDIIFMDISLADDFNGVEVMEIIRNHTRSPVIYITGISNNKLRRNAEKIENSCFLSKPIRLNELRQAVELMTVVS